MTTSNAAKGNSETVVPMEFPRDPLPASLAGSQPKLAAREINGRYEIGLDDEERSERYSICLDLVEQLTAYTKRKHIERQDLSMTELLDQIEVAARSKDWNVSPIELQWIMGELRSKFTGELD